MSEQLQLRRGTAGQIAAFTGAQGEVVIDTTNNRAVVQDGATTGGFAAAKLSEVLTNMRRVIADTATTIAGSDRLVAYASLTAPRVVTLCAASAFPTGAALTLIDESGSCSVANTLTLQAVGSDMINGAPSAVLASAHGYIALESDGVSRWTVVDSASFNSWTTAGSTSLQGSFGVGITAPTYKFVVSSNAASLPPAIPTGTIAQFGNVDGLNTRVLFDAYGSNPLMDLRTSNGTAASPLGLLSGTSMGGFVFEGYGTTSYSGAAAKLIAFAAENWTDTGHGTNFVLYVTPPGTAVPIVAMQLLGSGQITSAFAQADQSKSKQSPTTGFSITVSNASSTLLLTPAGPLATGTVTMPAAPVDGQIVRVLSSQAISALSVAANSGQSIIGNPTSIGPVTSFSMIYDFASTTWYRMS